MLEKLLKIVQLCFVLAITIAMGLAMLAVPVLLLYDLIAPFFGPDPLGHLLSIMLWVMGFSAFMAAVLAVLYGGSWAYEKFSFVRVALKAIGYTLAALLVVSTLSNCFDGGVGRCIPSRYIDC